MFESKFISCSCYQGTFTKWHLWYSSKKQNRTRVAEIIKVHNYCQSHLHRLIRPCKACCVSMSFLRTELQLLPVFIISVHAQSCDHCHGCHHLLVSPLCAGGWLHRFQKAPRAAAYPFSRSPVPFLVLRPLVVPPLPASISSVCSGTRL